MRVLLTNDDGIFAQGLSALRHVFEPVFDVTIVAPDREQSATGHGITVHRPLRTEHVAFPATSVGGIAVDGTPSDCVKLAIEALMPVKPDIVVSGINRGVNVGTDVLYSGTVSAAVEGVILGVPSIAVSLATTSSHDNCDYGLAAEFALKVAEVVLQKGLPSDTLLNINVPALTRNQIRGVHITTLGTRRYKNVFDKRSDPRGRTYYWLAGEAVDLDEGLGTDYTALKNGMISVTPVHFDLTNYQLVDLIRSWNLMLE